MKKILALLLCVFTVLVAACGCSKSPENSKKDNSSAIVSTEKEYVSSNTSSIKPSDKVALELFNKSADYIGRYYCSWTVDNAEDDLEGIKIDYKTRYKKDGTIAPASYTDATYVKSNYKYADAKAHFAKTFTGDMLDEFMKAYYIDLDGTLGVWHIGGASGISYSNVTLEYSGFKDGVHNYTASYYGRELDWEQTPLKCEFAIILTKDGYRVCKNEYNGGLRY